MRRWYAIIIITYPHSGNTLVKIFNINFFFEIGKLLSPRPIFTLSGLTYPFETSISLLNRLIAIRRFLLELYLVFGYS